MLSYVAREPYTARPRVRHHGATNALNAHLWCILVVVSTTLARAKLLAPEFVGFTQAGMDVAENLVRQRMPRASLVIISN